MARLLRYLYSLCLYLAVPLVLLQLFRLGLRHRGYWQRWPERFGLVPDAAFARRPWWIHAVSVGEVEAAVPLLQAIRRRDPDHPAIITTMTPTGADNVRRRFGDTVRHHYLPYDLPDAVGRFVDRVAPQVLVLMETELWPNLVHACHRRQVPVVLANARLSARSAAGYRRIAPLTRAVLQELSAVAAQTPADAVRFAGLGAAPASIVVTGSIKFDLSLPADLGGRARELRATLGSGRPILIAASTHRGEEEPVLTAFTEIRRDSPQALLVLVPRHPDRVAEVLGLCRQRGLAAVLRSSAGRCGEDTRVFIVDTLGELQLFYAAADVAFVGGSLVSVGGHNFLEPAAVGIPILTGPEVFNFAEIAAMLHEAGAAATVRSAAELAQRAKALLADAGSRARCGEAARRVVEANRGAAAKVLDLIDRAIATGS